MKVDLKTTGLKLDSGLREVADFDVRDVRGKPIAWDSVNKITHDANCGQNLQCALNAFTWKGVVLREEQVSTYRVPNDPDCPDRNPRGCNKGVCWSHAMYSPGRIKHPYKRAGARGEGKWERISWDQALTEIADKMLDVTVKYGPKTIIDGMGLEGGEGKRMAGMVLTQAAGMATTPGVNTEIGDDQDGALEMFGNNSFGDSVDNWYYSDILIVWCGNPSYTNITNYHYITEARYNGTEVWAITADYNPSSIPADLWVSVKPGSDAALGMGMSQVLLSEGLYNAAFIKEQTDLPLLVRADNQKFLRESDLEEGGRGYIFYMADAASDEIVEAPDKTLRLDVDPALEGEWEVDTLDGPVTVRTVFSMLKELVDREYTPEKASEMCGVHPDIIRTMARKFAKAKGVCQAGSTYGVGKYYHGNLMQRGMYYAWALCGHLGRKGTGINAMNGVITLESPVSAAARREGDGTMQPPISPEMVALWRERGFSPFRMQKEVFGLMEKEMINSSSLFYYLHAGLLELSEKNNSWDPYIKRPISEYVDEAFKTETRGVYPPPGTDPKVMIVSGGDPIRRVRANQHVIQTLIPKLELIFVADVRWNATARWADYVLPAAGYYERTTARGSAVFNTPFSHLTVKSAEPLYESRSDWWISIMLLRKIAERARARGISKIDDPVTGKQYRVDDLDEIVTSHGKYTENDDEAVARDSYDKATNIDLPDWDAVKKRGWAEYTALGSMVTALEFAGDPVPGEPWVPLTMHTVKKEPWFTLTGRIQFYIDHDWFLELGEAFAVHKDSIRGGGNYPIQLTGGHGRHSIHTTWSDNAITLQLQRGGPLMWMNRKDAAARGIADGDQVEVSNDVGDFRIEVSLSAAVRPGQAIIYHHWNNAQYQGWRHFQRVMPAPFNPVELAPVTYAEYPNLHRDVWSGEPGLNDRDTRVEIRKA